jgi:hypothetical protein
VEILKIQSILPSRQLKLQSPMISMTHDRTRDESLFVRVLEPIDLLLQAKPVVFEQLS